MTLKINQPLLATNLLDPISDVNYSGGVTGIAVTDIAPLLPRRIRLTLTGVSLAVLAANDYGSVKLCDLPDRNLHFLGLEADLSIVKGGATNGIVAATDLAVGIGSAAASASTLATTMIDFLEANALTADALTVTLAAHTLGQSTATFPKQFGDGATTALFLNLTTGNITANDSVTVNGTVDLYVIDIGNETS